MEYSINVVLDNDASPADVAIAVKAAALQACDHFAARTTLIKVDDQVELEPQGRKCQAVTIFRSC